MIPEEKINKFKQYIQEAKYVTIEELYMQFMEDFDERQIKYLLKKSVEDGVIKSIKRGEYEWVGEKPEVKPEINPTEMKSEIKPIETKPAEQMVVSEEQKPVETIPEQKKEEVALPETKKEVKEEPVKPKVKKEEPKKEEPDFLAKKRKEIEDLQVRKRKILEEPRKEPKESKELEEPKHKKEKGFPWMLVGIICASVVAVLLFVKFVLLGKREQARPIIREEPREEKGVLDQMGITDAASLFGGR